jgi:homopolymeric O-antigen transport system ATP-binding protein
VRTYSSGMQMRLGFAVASHLAVDVLLLDEVFAVGDEAFQRKCMGKILEFRERGGTVCFVSHSAPAVERLCERAVLLSHGEVEFDGTATDAIKLYHEQLALEESPEEVGAGLREWGSGEVRVEGVELVGGDGQPRARFLSGEPVVITLRLVGERPVPPPVLSIEVRDPSGSLLGANQRDLGELGWDGTPGMRELRFSLERLPLGEGEFQLSVALTDAAGTRRYHRVDGAERFEVEPSDHARGAVRLEGEWTLADADRKVEAS